MATILYHKTAPDGRMFDPSPGPTKMGALTRAGWVDHPEKVPGAKKNPAYPAAGRDVDMDEDDLTGGEGDPIEADDTDAVEVGPRGTIDRSQIDDLLDGGGIPDDEPVRLSTRSEPKVKPRATVKPKATGKTKRSR